MTRRRGRPASGLVAGLVAGVAGVAAALVLGGLTALPATAEPLSGLPVTVAITDIDPFVGPGDDVHLRVQVHNGSAVPVAQPRVLVHLDRSAFISRSSLDTWRTAGADGAVGTEVLRQDLTTPLAPGQTVTVDLTVPAGSVGLPRRLTSWGARGLAVQVVDIADPARTRLGLARTFLLWFPDQAVTATRLSVAAPVTGVGVDPLSGTWVDDLEELTSPGGRLDTLLAATGEHPDVTWVVDPWLTDPDNGAGPTARAWAADLSNHTVDREVQLLPYLDPDLAAIAHSGAGELLTAAIERAESTPDSLLGGGQVSVGWPADDLPDLTTVTAAARAGQDAVVVGPGELLASGVLTYSPSGRTTVTAGGEDVTVLVPDERLSAAFRTGVVGELDAEATDGVVTPATAGQDLLAELAVITRERPNDGRHLLITMPREWMANAQVVNGQLEALEAAPWVDLEPLSALVGVADPGVDRGTLPTRTVDDTEVDATTLGTVRDAVQRRIHLVMLVADPQSLIGDLELEQLAPTSVAWRADPTGRAASVRESVDATEVLAGAVTVQPPTSAVNLIANSGGLPIHVTNTFDQAVTVEVGLRSHDPRLIADETMEITLEPGAEEMVQIPVHAVQSGDYRVAVELRTPDGTLFDDSTEFEVRVRAEWESIGTAVLGALLVIGLVVGLFRTVRRGRTARRARPQAASGPDAMSPEEQAEEQAEEDAESADPAPDVHSTSSTSDADPHPPGPALVQGRDDGPPDDGPPDDARPAQETDST